MGKSLTLNKKASLKGKRILVTGGTSGYGRAMVLALLKNETRVATCARGKKRLLEVQKQGALAMSCDVSKEDHLKKFIIKIQEEFGGLDVAVNNAAVLFPGKVSEQPLEVWHKSLEINLTGPLLVTRAAAKIMKSGNIINITSGLGWFPMFPYNAYCVTKAGLNMLTRALAEEYKGYLRVNAIDPGTAKTRMNPTSPYSPEEILPIIRVLVSLGPKGPTGKCFKKNGEEVEW